MDRLARQLKEVRTELSSTASKAKTFSTSTLSPQDRPVVEHLLKEKTNELADLQRELHNYKLASE